jgi:hypothetical protein
MRRRVASLAACVIATASCAGCGGSQANVLFSSSLASSVASHRNAIGHLWAVGSVALCTRVNAPATLTGIGAVAVRGQIHLDRIAVRKVHEYRPGEAENPATHVIGTYPGVPPGSHVPNGFVVRSDCRFRRATAPYYEVVIVADRTGRAGGSIDGLRVDYTSEGSPGSYVIPFSFGLCGPRSGGGICASS